MELKYRLRFKQGIDIMIMPGLKIDREWKYSMQSLPSIGIGQCPRYE